MATMADGSCSIFFCRVMVWSLLMLFIIMATLTNVSSARLTSYYQSSLKPDVVDEISYGEPTSCKCRLPCIITPNCTAVTVKEDKDTGTFDCFFSNQTDLTPQDFEFEGTSFTWLRINQDPPLTPLTVPPPPTTSTTTSTTTTTTTTSTSTTTATTTISTTPTTSTSTSATTSTTPAPGCSVSTSAECFVVGNEESFAKAHEKCWREEAVLYFAKSKMEFDEVRKHLPSLAPSGEDELWVGISDGKWTDGMGYTRMPDNEEWIAGSQPSDNSKPCAYSKRGSDFLLEPEVCDDNRVPLCRVQDCTDVTTVPSSSEEVMMCKKTSWDNADQLCKDNGGRLYFSTSVQIFRDLMGFLDNNKRIFHKNMWVGVKDGRWTTGDDTVASIWKDGSIERGSTECASVEKGHNFLLKNHDCSHEKDVLCKKITYPDDHVKIPDVGSLIYIGGKTWYQDETECENKFRGKLYSPKTLAEFEALRNYLMTNTDSPLHQDMWVAVEWDYSNNDFKWSVGDPVTSNYWGTDQVLSTSNQLCGFIAVSQDFKLQKAECNDVKTMLCKIVEP